MSTKVLLRIVIAAGLLVAVVVAVFALYTSTASAPATSDAAARPANYYAGSDWIERHPSAAVRPANYYTGSDWIERHPSAAARPANYYAGSDWIERHPSNYYVGSDWIERHPSMPTP